MSRPPIKLTADQLLQHLEGKLTNLEGMCQLYDQGNPYIAFAMASEIRKILTENVEAQRARHLLRFRTYRDNPRQKENLASMAKLLMLQLTPPGAQGEVTGTVAHLSRLVEQDALDAMRLPFREWWNRDLIYVATAAPHGTPAGSWPTAEPFLAWDKREKMTRRSLIDLVRNKFGAHLDAEIPAVLDDLQSSKTLGAVFAMPNPNGGEDLSTENGGVKVTVGPAAAMVRAIAQEVLVAYGRLPA